MGARLGIAQASHKPCHTAPEFEWQNQAICHGMPDEYFFPHASAYISPEAKQVCDACPVRRDCLIFALKHGAEGIWGGTTEQQRRALKKKIARTPSPCGTPAAFQRHIRDGEQPCDECREARNVEQRAYYAANTQTLLQRRQASRRAGLST